MTSQMRHILITHVFQYLFVTNTIPEGGEGGGENDITNASHLRHILITHVFQYLFVTNSTLEREREEEEEGFI